jgi:hypothetical protein
VGIILLPEGRENWGWCGFGKVLCFLLQPYLTVKQLPPTFHGDPCVGKSASQTAPAVKTTCTPAIGVTSSSDTAYLYGDWQVFQDKSSNGVAYILSVPYRFSVPSGFS